MTDQTIYQQLRTHLSYLGLRRAAEVLASHLDDAQRDDTSATVFLERLLAEEVAATEQRRLAGRLRFAHFPADKRGLRLRRATGDRAIDDPRLGDASFH
jgi:DNA replication protein DnaC